MTKKFGIDLCDSLNCNFNFLDKQNLLGDFLFRTVCERTGIKDGRQKCPFSTPNIPQSLKSFKPEKVTPSKRWQRFKKIYLQLQLGLKFKIFIIS